MNKLEDLREKIAELIRCEHAIQLLFVAILYSSSLLFSHRKSD